MAVVVHSGARPGEVMVDAEADFNRVDIEKLAVWMTVSFFEE